MGRRSVLAKVLGIAGVLLLGLALLAMFAASLGFAGILGDVSPAENRDFGWQFLRLSAWPGLPGLVLVAGAALLPRPDRSPT